MTPETKAFRTREKFINKLTPIAYKVEVLEVNSKSHEFSIVAVLVSDSVMLQGVLRDINPMLEKLGFRPVRLTKNMLNEDAKYFAIDINTPHYCDPGCESYHSM